MAGGTRLIMSALDGRLVMVKSMKIPCTKTKWRRALYDLIEQEVVPLFYERDAELLPRRWITKMKDAIQLNCPFLIRSGW